MTPALRAAVTALGLTSQEFAALTNHTPVAVSRWGKTREEPAWAWVLVRAWQACPEALRVEQERLGPQCP
jgi:hypothetical protein